MKTYLGDSVYCQFVALDRPVFVLTTENGLREDPSNTIVMEPEIIRALNQFVERIENSKKENVNVN